MPLWLQLGRLQEPCQRWVRTLLYRFSCISFRDTCCCVQTSSCTSQVCAVGVMAFPCDWVGLCAVHPQARPEAAQRPVLAVPLVWQTAIECMSASMLAGSSLPLQLCQGYTVELREPDVYAWQAGLGPSNSGQGGQAGTGSFSLLGSHYAAAQGMVLSPNSLRSFLARRCICQPWMRADESAHLDQ